MREEHAAAGAMAESRVLRLGGYSTRARSRIALQRLEEFTHAANGFVSGGAAAALQERADEIQREALRASASEPGAAGGGGRRSSAATSGAPCGLPTRRCSSTERLTRARDVRRQARKLRSRTSGATRRC